MPARRQNKKASSPSQNSSSSRRVASLSEEKFPEFNGNADESQKMIDWKQAFTLPFEILVSVFLINFIMALFVGYNERDNPAIFSILFISILVAGMLGAFTAIWAQFKGITFDAGSDTLVYPAYFVRKSIPLSEIRDGNCEYIRKGTIFLQIISLFNNAKKSRSKPSPLYVVNLSGEFGVRPIRFFSKMRRDQFLSLLRYHVPGCRITRWASGW